MTSSEELAAQIRVLSEEELGEWMRERGRRIVFSRGRFWADHWGFLRLLHFAATMPANELGRPTRRTWAYHTLLPDDDAQQANAWYPLHLIRDLSLFDEQMLDSGARKQLRRCKARLQVVRLNDPDLLRAQGWPIFHRNARRIGLHMDVTEEEYLAGVDHLVLDPRRLTIGAMDGDRLLGYLETYAVHDTAYLDHIRLSDEALSRHVSGFLHFEASQLYRRSGLIKQVCAGVPLAERTGISELKRRWGIPIVLMPAHFWSPAPFRALLKAARPAAYYRATGLSPEASQDGLSHASPVRPDPPAPSG